MTEESTPRRKPGPKPGTVPAHLRDRIWKQGEGGGGEGGRRKRPIEDAVRTLLTGSIYQVEGIPPRIRELAEAFLDMAKTEPPAMRELWLRIDGAPQQDQAVLPDVTVTVVTGGVQRPTVAAPLRRDLPPTTVAAVGIESSAESSEIVPTTAVVVTRTPRPSRVVEDDDDGE